MPARLLLLVLLLLVPAAGLPAPAAAQAQTPVAAARALVARYHDDPTAIDRARDLLEAALKRDSQVETLVMLSYVHFLWADVRATTTEDKLAAYGRGRELGERAVELAPKNHDAHLWYAINTGRWGQTKGVMRSLFLLPTVRRELDTMFELNPRSVRAHSLAGNVSLEVPGLFGGDKEKAEEHFKKGLAIDPKFTVLRVDLARVYIATDRYDEARRELRRVIDEAAPTNVADWTVKDLPRARKLLESIKDKK
ncbi:MAG: tetratricopeptide repeat protein [candidate division NC10 bacterium]